MRTALTALALLACSSAIPAQAQREDVLSARNFARVAAHDRDGRDLLILVSQPRPDNPRPYRAIVAWGGSPHRYWSLSFAFDCRSGASISVESIARRWDGSKYESSAPIAEAYRGYIDALLAPAICEPGAKRRVPTFLGARSAARDFIRRRDSTEPRNLVGVRGSLR